MQYCTNIYCRGNDFWKTFAEIVTVQILINKDIKFIILTLTAASSTKIIFERLAMVNVNIIGLPPERANIKYTVVPMPTMAELCSTLALELKTHCFNTPKTVVFCQTLQQCGDFHAKMKKEQGRNLTEPPELPCINHFEWRQCLHLHLEQNYEQKCCMNFAARKLT